MDFIQTSNKQVDKFGAGKHGFSAGTPGVSLATFMSNEWCDSVQQELVNVIEGAGVAVSGAALTQVRQATKRLFAGNIGTITVAGPTALTADNAGLVLVDATANNVAITLPAANAVAGVPLEFKFVRVDATANTVTISRAGADTYLGGATSFTLVGLGDLRVVQSDAASKWAVIAQTSGAIVDRAYADTATFSSLTVQIPNDDSFPQNNEGTQLLSVSITPKSTTNKLRITWGGWVTPNTLGAFISAVFSTVGGANAHSANITSDNSASAQYFGGSVEFVPGTLAAQTITLRAGPDTAVTMYLNGTSAGRLLGGASRTFLIVEEIKA